VRRLRSWYAGIVETGREIRQKPRASFGIRRMANRRTRR
jgi:hypothetical protein